MEIPLRKQFQIPVHLIMMILFVLWGGCYSLAQNANWTLVWSDEFDVDGLPDSSKWVYDTGGSGWGNNELEYYTANRSENAKVENGNLLITARKESYGGKSYTSARLKTKGRASWKYGKIEARIKLPYGQGIWPAFWMLGGSFQSVGWPACGEIDIMEMVGGSGKDNTIHGTAHWDAGGHQSSGTSKTLQSGTYADDFHVFSIEWNEGSIKWFVDNTLFFTLSIASNDKSEFHRDFFIILNLAVGGNWPGNPDGSTIFPQTMRVDYVRVFADSTTLASISPNPSNEFLHVFPKPTKDGF